MGRTGCLYIASWPVTIASSQVGLLRCHSSREQADCWGLPDSGHFVALHIPVLSECSVCLFRGLACSAGAANEELTSVCYSSGTPATIFPIPVCSDNRLSANNGERHVTGLRPRRTSPRFFTCRVGPELTCDGLVT